jgi:hypothetical protein
MLTCVKDCQSWYYVTNASNPLNAATTADPQTWRGDLTFTSTSAFTASFTHTSGATATANHTYTLGSNFALTADGSVEGQMTAAQDFFAAGGNAAPLQIFGVRKGSGLSKGSIAGTYRIRGLLAKTNDATLLGLSATITLDVNGCITSGSGQRTDGVAAPIAITFVKATGASGTGCATVSATGELNLQHQQQTTAGTQIVSFVGWVGSAGDVLLFTRNESIGFQPGVFLGLREKSSHGLSKVKGTYAVTHLVSLNSVRGTVILNNGSVTGGTLDTIGQSGIAVTGGNYLVTGVGRMVANVKDTVLTAGGNQAGQASSFTAGGLSPILVTSVAATYDSNAGSSKPSLMAWVLRN